MLRQFVRQIIWAGMIALLAACQPTTDPDNPFAPTGAYDMRDSVDGLIVGHRLMAAGEYQLALRAYLRAAADQGLTVDTLSAIGSAQLQLGRLGQAESTLRRAVEMDPSFPAAWNNLGVVLMEKGETAEAELVFRRAFATDSGRSDSIRDNLRLAIAINGDLEYVLEDNNQFNLVRRGYGSYLLLIAPDEAEQ